MSLTVVMSGHNGEVYYRGMTESDWKRLHARVIPNPLSLDEFKDVVLAGKLQDRYLAKDLHKMMQELRDLLREHGELREAALFPLSGKKQELALAAAAAVRVIDARRDRVPALRRSPGGVHTALELGEGRDGSTSPTLDSASDQQRLSNSGSGNGEPTSALQSLPAALATSTTTSPRRSSRVLPLVGHISPEEAPLAAPSSSSPSLTAGGRTREQAVPRSDSAERSAAGQVDCSGYDGPAVAPRPLPSWTRNEHLSSTIAKHAATTAPPSPTNAATSAASASSVLAAPQPPLTPSPSRASAVGPSATVSTGTVNELAQLNETAPPFFRILGVARRFQLRFGSSPLRFEIPVQYTDAVNNRRLRVFLIPLRHPNIPARWPTAKEIVVYVNEQCVMTPWKRAWPERKQEVAKTLLPLDITYLLSRNVPSQRMQVDIFNKEYLSPAVVAVVQPLTLEEVTEAMLLSRLGCRSAAQVQLVFASQAAMTGEIPPGLLVANDAAVSTMYAAALEEDEDEDGFEADDPVIATKCPISKLPLVVPVRGCRCTHLQCVDLESFLVSSNRGAYWNCALCDAEMRAKDVQIDTVLWRYLYSFGSPDRFPAHLRLSARSGTGTSQGKYYWHPDKRAGDDADVISDGDRSDEEERDSAGEDRRVKKEEGEPQSTGVVSNGAVSSSSTSASPYALPIAAPTLGADLRAAADLSLTAAGRERKRDREGEESGGEEPQGTADDPIEL